MNNPGDSGDGQGRRPPNPRPVAGGGGSTVRQNFPHGRTKVVVVEIKPKRGVHATGPGNTPRTQPNVAPSRNPDVPRATENRTGAPLSGAAGNNASAPRPMSPHQVAPRAAENAAAAERAPAARPPMPTGHTPRASSLIPSLNRPVSPRAEDDAANMAPDANTQTADKSADTGADGAMAEVAIPADIAAPAGPNSASEEVASSTPADNQVSASNGPSAETLRPARPAGRTLRAEPVRSDGVAGQPNSSHVRIIRPDQAGRPEGFTPREPRTDGDRGAPRPGGRTLSPEEMAARQRALTNQGASDQQRREVRRRADEAHYRREQASVHTRLLEAEARRKLEAEALELQDLEARRRREEDLKAKKADSPERARSGTETKRIPGMLARAPVDDVDDDADGASSRAKRAKSGAGAAAAPGLKGAISRTKGEPKRRDGKLTVVDASNEEGDRWRSLASLRRAREREKEKRIRQLGEQETQKVVRDVVVPEVISVGDLANRMAERAADVMKYLMKQGTMATMHTVLDADTAELIVADFGHSVKRVADSDVEEGLVGAPDPEQDLDARPPVVTIMGHVDHGKTSLLDALRHTDVVAGEAGGITQHIGAYQVQLKNNARITFLDTPGHAAFSGMRARGAQVTDIVVLVIAADDGVMPQTAEAISHAKAAGVPMIVAVNKIDKADADPQKAVQSLLQYDVIPEALGGDVQVVEVSALKKIGLDALTDAILLQAEVLQLTANPNRAAEGVVIEAQLDQGRGAVATVLVKRGTLRRGDIVVAGSQWGRVRALVNERKQQLKEAEPSTPVEVLGLDGAPEPGDQVVVVENEARAREIVDYRQRLRREKTVGAPSARASLESMMAKLKQSDMKEMPVLIKSDVQGSGEAIAFALDKLGTSEVRARVIHSGVGGISESDVLLAKSSGAPILAFNVRANKQARDMAEAESVEIRYYSIIYNLIDDIKGALSGMLAPERRETFIGYANILEVFNITKVGKVAGCRVSEGAVRRGCGVRLLRDNVVIHEGKLSTLKRFKDEVPEVNGGQECGMAFENYQDIRQGDQIECFTVETIQRKLA